MTHANNADAASTHDNQGRLGKMAQEIVGDVVLILGVLSAGLGIKGFLTSNGFIDGGVTGVSMLLADITHWPIAILLPVVNVPFIVISYWQLGWVFAVRSALGIGGLALALATVPYPDVTQDPMLSALFGGLFIGAGIGLAMRANAVLDGTEIAALLISRRSPVLKVGDVILVFNLVLFLASMTLLGINQALYSIVTYFAATKTLDFILYGFDEYTAVTVVSQHPSEIRASITGKLGRGVTVFHGFGGHSGTEKEILYCVVTRLELGRLKDLIREVDPIAFITFHPLSGAEGGMLKARNIH